MRDVINIAQRIKVWYLLCNKIVKRKSLDTTSSIWTVLKKTCKLETKCIKYEILLLVFIVR